MQQISTYSDLITRKNIINRISYIPGGVSLVLSTLTAGKVVPEGTPLSAPTDGKRTICKQAVLLTGSTTTVMRVASESNPFKTGDIIFQALGGAAYAGTVAVAVGEVDGVSYDTITVGTALESGAAGTYIYQSSVSAGEGADTGALEKTADVVMGKAFEVPSASQVIYMNEGLLRADVVEGCIGALYLASLDVKEVKY